MTDRELLELAAKAAGIGYTVNDDDYYKTHAFFGLWLVYDGEPSEYARRYWNPLTDDGDALRLSVKLGICFGQNFDGDLAVCFGEDGRNITESFVVGKYAATRRAIVRAAAEIGKAME